MRLWRVSRIGLLLIGGLMLGAALVPALAPAIALRSLGRLLISNDPLPPADIIVVSPEAGGPGVLEAADLVRGDLATRVAVFMDAPSDVEREYLRRGLPYENEVARQIRQLKALGVKQVLQIPRLDAGTGGIGDVLPSWCRENKIKSLIFVTTTDHSRRMRRVLVRAMSGEPTVVAVRPARFSAFDPDKWWETSVGIRTLVFELQKLLRDMALHPF